MKRKEAIRYLENAKDILSKSPIEDNIYLDDKYVKSACGDGIFGGIKGILKITLKQRFIKKELPKKVEEYMKALKKYASPYNGKLVKEFDALYDTLHIAGYYRGLLHSTSVVKEALKAAQTFIEKLSKISE